MLFSVFTPTHNPQFLLEAYDSLLRQTAGDWEWVIVPNSGVTLPEPLQADARILVVPAPDYMPRQGIGALKRFACEQCRGDYLVELDHDDRLASNALARIRAAVAETGATFLYSDFANFYPDGTGQVYDAGYGWESYPVTVDGRDYTAMRAFAPDPSGLAAIFYAPNHVRVWERQAYFRAGGHDPLLAVCDDYDLVCRTYLAGARFHHIPECLYLYRMQPEGSNTFIQRNQEIQVRQQEVSNRYIYAIIERWCRDQGLPMLDLGGAHGCPPGFRSVDVADADVCCDIRYGLPFPDSSVGCIRAYDFLEHVPHCGSVACDHGAGGGPRCTVGLMNEIYRVLAPGGWLISRTPSTDGRGAFQDPTHASFWNPNSFWYYTRRQQAAYLRGMTARFQGNRIWQAYPSTWHEEHKILYVFADLVALKGQRQAGICEI
jgi:glycosyltransferase involved in cell wall biosynthesis